MLTAVFSFGGYYVGSRDQKIDIALPSPATPIVSQSASPASVVKSKVVSAKISSPVQNTSSQQTAQVTPVPTPAPTPTPVPVPKTTVS